VFSTKSHSLVAAALVTAGALALSISPGFGAVKSGVMLAQQDQSTEQTQPSTEQTAPADTATPAGSDDSGSAPPSDGADQATTPEAAPPPDAGAPAADAPSSTEKTDSNPAKADDTGTTTDDSKSATPDNSTEDVAPIAPQSPSEAAEPSVAAPSTSAASAIDASQLKIGTAVFGSDGQKIGEVNGVKSDTSGKVQEILVTDGVAAGLNAKVFAISGDKITGVSDGVKLSLSSEEAKKLPIIDNSNG
jgi:hypothetical protein